MKLQLLSENSLIVYLGEHIDPQVALKVRTAVDLIRQQLGDRVLDMVPSYNSIHLTFNLAKTDPLAMQQQFQSLLARVEQQALTEVESQIVEIPVYYGAEVALDLDEMSGTTGLSPAEIVQLHAAEIYTVYAIGFSPGFAYLGNTDARLRVPRKSTPRTKIPAGSLGVADNQTAIYPSTSPGGWNILGRTPIDLVDFSQPDLTPLKTGDRVQFKAIDRDTYLAMGGEF